MSHGARSSKQGSPTRIKIIVPRDRLTACIRLGDQTLDPVTSKEDLIHQWHGLKMQGQITDGQANWLLNAILTCGLRAMTRRGAANTRLFGKQLRRERQQRTPLDTLGGVSHLYTTARGKVAIRR
ncbi:MAG: hypothetical protein E6R05_03755 [Candidatus Moraniibacteriota bacterium]|nr:MAG: hypothetical protein E6R05_03755 [Candidatus Moranbacteria bacterium]